VTGDRWRTTVFLGGRVVISTVLAMAVWSKVVDGYREEFGISRAVYYGVAMFEIAVVAMLWTRIAVAAAWILVVGLCLGSAYLWWVMVESSSCGCFGTWHMSDKAHNLTVAGLGALALAVCWAGTGAPEGGQKN